MGGLFSTIERAAAFAQGKGYGSKSIRREVRAAASLMPEQPHLIIDIGGNKGAYTDAVRDRFPSAEIHIFEPARSNIEHLNIKFKDNVQVIVQPHALGEIAGHAVLHADVEGSGMASLTQRNVEHFNIRFDHHEPISVMRFEDYWSGQLHRRPIALAKLDVEGHELAVLKGFGSAIEHTQVIQFEFGGCNIDTRTYFQDFWYFFQANGFELHRITPFALKRVAKYSESDEFFSTTNFLACASSRR
jgi:FkbM family methyltransferase